MNTKPVIAIDPGPLDSGLVYWNGSMVDEASQLDNDFLRNWLRCRHYQCVLRIEALACYGMPVGAETFETAYWIGRFAQTWEDTGGTVSLRPRRDVKLFWCGNARAKDSNIRQAILDRFGGKEKAIGKKATPGPLYGVKGHCWSALALALIE